MINRQIIINIEARIKSIFYNLIYNPFQRNIFIIFTVLSIVGYVFISNECFIFVICYVLVCILSLLFWISQVFESVVYDSRLRSKRMCNENDEYPVLIYSRKINSKQFEIVFRNIGIPLHKWQEAKLGLSSSFHKEIASIKSTHRNKHISIILYKDFYNYSKTRYWDDSYMVDGPNLVLGEMMGEPLSMSLIDNPHFLIGGMTGSGKTYLALLLLYQCIKKNYMVYIADFKMGVDYNSFFQKHSEMMFNKASVLTSLKEIRDEMLRRFTVLASSHYNNIEDYNKNSQQKLKRIIFACDELASLIDLKSLNKEDKQITYEIIRLIEEIAEKGRAVGVNLLLSLQRPDADILPGRIKNNLAYKTAGKCDQHLSGIIIGTTEASKEIENFDVGVFYDNYGNKYKVYLIPEENFKD